MARKSVETKLRRCNECPEAEPLNEPLTPSGRPIMCRCPHLDYLMLYNHSECEVPTKKYDL